MTLKLRLTLMIFVLLASSGCTWTNTIWLIPEDKKTTHKIELLTKKPELVPFALLEAKGIKTWDSNGDLIGSNIEKAKAIGADKIWCPSDKDEAQHLMGMPLPITKEEIGLFKEFFIAVTDLIKAVIAMPVTFRSEALSKTTLLCSVYRN